MPLRVGIDLDGVLADMDGELARQATRLFGSSPLMTAPAEDAPASPAASDDPAPPLRLNLTARQQRRLWDHVATIENFWLTLDELEPGAIARLAALAAASRWEVIFLTRRPQTAGLPAQVQTQRWLEAKGFPLPSAFVVPGSRGRIAAALSLDVVVDDRTENCLAVVVDSRASAILIARDRDELPLNAQRLGVRCVATFSECLDVLAEMSVSPPPPPSVASRALRMFGRRDRK
jgi:hypothetical protein